MALPLPANRTLSSLTCAPSCCSNLMTSMAGMLPQSHLRFMKFICIFVKSVQTSSSTKLGSRPCWWNDGRQLDLLIGDLQSILCFSQCAVWHSLPQYYSTLVVEQHKCDRSVTHSDQSAAIACQRSLVVATTCVISTRRNHCNASSNRDDENEVKEESKMKFCYLKLSAYPLREGCLDRRATGARLPSVHTLGATAIDLHLEDACSHSAIALSCIVDWSLDRFRFHVYSLETLGLPFKPS